MQPFLAGGVSIALEKSNSGVRPLCCGDPLRRLVGKCFCLGGKEDISKEFSGKNFGVGCPGGVEVVAHSLRNVLEGHAEPHEALLKIDFRNAFNLIDRSAFVRACIKFPGLSQWTQWCYGSPTILLYDHEHVISSTRGVQQGDPLGPLYFCCGISVLIDKIQEFGPRYNKWYMDDGGICSSAEKLVAIWEMLCSESPKLGLELNPAKCEWSWLDPSCTKPCPISVHGDCVGANRRNSNVGGSFGF